MLFPSFAEVSTAVQANVVYRPSFRSSVRKRYNQIALGLLTRSTHPMGILLILAAAREMAREFARTTTQPHKNNCCRLGNSTPVPFIDAAPQLYVLVLVRTCRWQTTAAPTTSSETGCNSAPSTLYSLRALLWSHCVPLP